MKIVEVNGGVVGSTGKIMFGIAEEVYANGGHALCFSPITVSNRYQKPKHSYDAIGTFRSRQLNVLLERITGFSGCFSLFVTMTMIRKISTYKPNIIQLHNIHGGYINIPLLFNYIRKNKIKLVWTFHDCWPFTGHCPHFDMIGCDKWKFCCENCPQYKEYPMSIHDNSKIMYKMKRKWFTSVDDLTIVTPSRWLSDIVKQSFFKKYPVEVINNGIDLAVFKPVRSELKKEYNCISKYVVLGVAFGWNEKKGLDVFIELSKHLQESKYQIILVGTDEKTDVGLPDNIISVHRTESQAELAEIYTAADVFVNPTREENYPTVNMEAIACGTPVVTFNTGGSREILNETCGSVVDKDDIEAMMNEIIRVCEERPYTKEDCLKRALAFDKNIRYREYLKLYEET